MIEIESLKSGYGEKTAVEIDRLAFDEGKITGIVGLNGSGKSTLLQAVIGLNPYKGNVLIDGKSARSLGHKNRAKLVSYFPQINQMANMDIYTLASHGRFPYLGYSKVPGQRDIELIEKALRMTDLWQLRDKNLGEVSGGERQRAYLARVVAQDTPYLLLDAAVNHLDIVHQIKIMEILKVLAGEGRGVVLTSHDFPQSFTVCDQICLLKEGRLAATGKPSEIADSKLLSDAMGVGLSKNSDSRLLYDFSLSR